MLAFYEIRRFFSQIQFLSKLIKNCFGQSKREKRSKIMCPVWGSNSRPSDVYFGLWDWRAAYCANEAPVHNYLFFDLFFSNSLLVSLGPTLEFCSFLQLHSVTVPWACEAVLSRTPKSQLLHRITDIMQPASGDWVEPSAVGTWGPGAQDTRITTNGLKLTLADQWKSRK